MKIKNLQIVNSMQGLSEISEKEMPYKVTLKISKNIRKLEEVINDYKLEYDKLVDEYYEKDENGNFIPVEGKDGFFIIRPDKAQEYSEKINTLNEFENDIDLYLIEPSELEDIKISPRVLMQIDFMIDDTENI